MLETNKINAYFWASSIFSLFFRFITSLWNKLIDPRMTGSVIDTRLQSITVNIFLQRSFVERECFYIFLSSAAFNDVRSTVCVVECEFSQTASVDHSGLRMFEATESNAFRNEETKNSGTRKICCICHSSFSIRGNPTRNEWYWKYLHRDSICSFQPAVFSGMLFFDRNIFPRNDKYLYTSTLSKDICHLKSISRT